MKKSQLRMLCMMALVGVSSIYGMSQTVHANDATVTVTANRAKTEAQYNSQAVTVLDQKDIAKKQAKSVEELVFNQTGVSRTVDSMGRVGVSIRGAEARHTLILVDGQPALGDFAKYLGAGDELSRIGTENLDRVEIIRGASSALYGSDAIGGVVNIVTRKASPKRELTFNADFRALASEKDMPKHGNYFLRADSGQLGKVRIALYGSKREMIPVYATAGYKPTGSKHESLANFPKNTLRFDGNSSNIGIVGTVDLNKKNSIDVRLDRYSDRLQRFIKHSDSDMEPVQHFKRNIDRKTGSLVWNYKGANTTWNTEVNYTRVKEGDIAVTSDSGHNIYEGDDTLNYVDDVDHRQFDMHTVGTTSLSDKHMLTFGFGIKQEKGEGSRLKNAPNHHTIKINPWDYDKDLSVNRKGKPYSTVHDYKFVPNKDGVMTWDSSFEWYGYSPDVKGTTMPDFTYEDYVAYIAKSTDVLHNIETMPADKQAAWKKLQDQLAKDPSNQYNMENSWFSHTDYDWDTFTEITVQGMYPDSYKNNLPLIYFDPTTKMIKEGTAAKYNGKYFGENKDGRNNDLTIGKVTIRKEHAFLQDTWQVTDNTILTPTIRLDHSNLYGSNTTFNLGLTHFMNGDAHTRIKANIGTGYAEPGMGELYYNWEMFGSHPVDGWFGGGVARLGWYWVGNPLLKPEKSVNFDLTYEKDTKNTSFKASVFHNRIDNYLTIFYTGHLLDFHPELNEHTGIGGAKYINAPDMIYSFKNIGRAEITGLETSIQHKFNKHWSTSLGYTYLHTENKSDPLLPKQLLDKPMHKIDFSLSFNDDTSGWSGTISSDYYLNMLDSKSVSGNGNYIMSNRTGEDSSEIVYTFNVDKKPDYQKKSYGLWNIMIQKKLGKDALAYFGINNVFNHHDDDMALQERNYQMGMNMKVSLDSLLTAAGSPLSMRGLFGNAPLESFFAPTLGEKVIPFEFEGSYRLGIEQFSGKSAPHILSKTDADITQAADNLLSASKHGFDQRLQVGFHGSISPTTAISVLGSLQVEGPTETAYSVPNKSGLHKGTLDKAELTHKAGSWNLSIGRLSQSFGATGYYFGQSFDGGRATYTSDKDQLQFGFGSFKHTTGITDTAYTKARQGKFLRAATIDEFIGTAPDIKPGMSSYAILNAPFKEIPPNAEGTTGLYPQFNKASETGGTPEEIAAAQGKVLAKFLKEAITAYPNIASDTKNRISTNASLDTLNYNYKEDGSDDVESDMAFGLTLPDTIQYIPIGELAASYNGNAEETMNAWMKDHESLIKDAIVEAAKDYAKDSDYTFVSIEDSDMEAAVSDVKKSIIKSLTRQSESKLSYTFRKAPRIKGTQFNIGLFKGLYNALKNTDGGSPLPREALKKNLGITMESTGTIIENDEIPAVNRAFFAQWKHKLTPSLGLNLWTLQSTGDHKESIVNFNGTENTTNTYDRLASVFGIGTQWQIGPQAALTIDAGVNNTAWGKHMNGTTTYTVDKETEAYQIAGYKVGNHPTFFTARLGIGQPDIQRAGTWSAFVDYKRFEHGSFFGGNGTQAVPDRYLDGIQSFTVGAAYVPVRNFLIEGFYTFGAKGLQPRMTLFGPEKFELGNYAKVQVTYHF